jgi:branched-chain amino acid transport system ATP-binding protein
MTSVTDKATNPLLEIERLEVRYGHALALTDVSLSLEPGSVLAVLGPNGAGKSTLARAISGLIPVKTGTIRFGDQTITSWHPDRIRREGLVHLPEGRGVFRGLTVNENLRIATSLLPRSERAAALARAYDIFPALTGRRRQAAGTLSGGEQQMVAIGRALMARPTLVCMDEPSMGLSPAFVEQVFEIIQAINRQGMTIFMVEQNANMALSIASRGYVLQTGQVVLSGTAQSLRENEMIRSAYLGEIKTA